MTRFRLVVAVIAIGMALHIAARVDVPCWSAADIAANPALLAVFTQFFAATTFCIIALVVFMLSPWPTGPGPKPIPCSLPSCPRRSPSGSSADRRTIARAWPRPRAGSTIWSASTAARSARRGAHRRPARPVSPTDRSPDPAGGGDGARRSATIGDGYMAGRRRSTRRSLYHLKRLARMALLELADCGSPLSAAHGVDLKIRVWHCRRLVMAGVIGADKSPMTFGARPAVASRPGYSQRDSRRDSGVGRGARGALRGLHIRVVGIYPDEGHRQARRR